MLPFRLVYHELYDLHLGDHVFPSKKYRWLRDRLMQTRFAQAEDFIQPEPATDADVLLVHHREWVTKLRSGTLSYQDIQRLEIPYSRQMVEAFWLAAGGTILAARLALKDGVGSISAAAFTTRFRVTGKAFARSTISRLPSGGCRAMGPSGAPWWWIATYTTATGRRRYSRTIHRCSRSPSISSTTIRIEKPLSSLDIHLPDGIGDAEYLHRLGNGYRAAFAMFKPELVLYVAGADPYGEDQLGGLNLTFDGLRERDRLVMWTALTHKIPVAIVLAGGYAQSVEDTITIHANTAAVAKDVLTWGSPPKERPQGTTTIQRIRLRQ